MGEAIILERKHDNVVRDFLKRTADATVYHTLEWRDAVEATYGYRSFYLGYLENDDLVTYLPLMLVKSWLTGSRLVSLPFSNACGIVGSREHVASLTDKALRLSQQIGSTALEIRTQSDLNPVEDARFTRVSYFLTSIVDLDSDPVRVWKRFRDRNLRTEVRQAAKKGIEVRDGRDMDDLRRFYSLFVSSRLRHGVPPQPLKFFLSLWQHLWPTHMNLFLATFQGEAVGGLITLRFGDTMCAAYIGSDYRYRSHRVHQILFWKAMEMGCNKGHKRFDFLRTPKSSKSQRYFKQRWNAYEVDLDYLYYPQVRGTASTVEETPKYRLMMTLLKHSPEFVGRLLGKMLYRHVG